MSISRVLRLLPAAGVLLAAACNFTDPGQPSGSNVVVALRADTTVVGELVFFRSGQLNDTSRATGSRIFYRNNTTRTVSNLGVVIHPAIQGQPAECITPFRPTADTLLGTVPPGGERSIQFGLFAPFVLVYVPSAGDGTRALVSRFAGRWQGTATEFRGTAPTARTVFAASGSDGDMVVYPQTVTSDGWVATGNVGPARRLLAYNGVNCNANWVAVDSASTLTVGTDSLIYRGRAVAAQGAFTQVDSFVIRLSRRP
ncbi:MAG: hypothetical protein MUF53_10855 [Gemmatimonadaceae bacterium]|jgi:hypothetical protein|nr:hypothetical protein [Gemmatimonadaceae bacterium]